MPSKYTPQLSYWYLDLYKRDSSSLSAQALNLGNNMLKHNETLRFVNDDYCEISRRRSNARYHHLLLQILTGLFALVTVSFLIFFLCTGGIEESVKIYTEADSKHKGSWTLVLIMTILWPIIGIKSFNYYLFAPKDYPLRFNRKTGKVYVYDYPGLYTVRLTDTIKSLFTPPFIFPTRPVEKVFDWQDIQAVITCYSSLYKGIRRSNSCVYAVVCSPGTTQMTDKFRINIIENDFSNTADRLWVWICSYMTFNDMYLDKTLVNRDNFWGNKIIWSDEFAKESIRSK